MAIALVVLAMVSSAALMTPRIQARVDQIRIDMIDYGKQNAATSTGIRLELWKHSATIIAAAPLLGHGLGQWAAQYEARAQDLMANPLFRVIKHPHQEALLILSEQGVLGFAAFILLLVMLLRYLRQLDQSHRDFFTALVLIYVTAGLANCVLVDFSHRHVFLMLLACVPLLDRKSVAGHVYRMEAARS